MLVICGIFANIIILVLLQWYKISSKVPKREFGTSNDKPLLEFSYQNPKLVIVGMKMIENLNYFTNKSL